MRERDDLRSHLAVQAAQAMLLTLARSALAIARAEEARAIVHLERADGIVRELTTYWMEHIGPRSTGIDALLRVHSALATASTDQENARLMADEAADAAQQAHNLLAQRAAQLANTTDRVRRMRRRLRQRDDERELRALEDRITRAWVAS